MVCDKEPRDVCTKWKKKRLKDIIIVESFTSTSVSKLEISAEIIGIDMNY